MKVLPCYCFDIHFNIIFPPTRTCSLCFLQVTPPQKKTPLVSHTSPIPFFFNCSPIYCISDKLWAAFDSSLCNLLHLHFTSYLFDPDQPSSSVPCSQTLSANVRLSPTPNSCHTHRQQQTQLRVCLHVWIFVCLKTTTGTTRHSAHKVAKQSHKSVRSYLLQVSNFVSKGETNYMQQIVIYW